MFCLRRRTGDAALFTIATVLSFAADLDLVGGDGGGVGYSVIQLGVVDITGTSTLIDFILDLKCTFDVRRALASSSRLALSDGLMG